jgi:dipeptidyl aminopeptidase/acylaminoacyl peptidase
MRALVLATLLSLPGAAAVANAVPAIDLGDIPQRPLAPEFPFDAFLQTRGLGQIEFAPHDHTLYVLRDDGQVNNIFALDLDTPRLRQVTHSEESVAEFFVDPKGRYLLAVLDNAGNEAFDLYRVDLATGAMRRLTETAAGDRCTVCGLSPDGAMVYYTQTRDARAAADLWRLELASGRAHRLLSVDGRVIECEAISPDGRFLLLAELLGLSERHLVLSDVAAGRTRPVMRAPGSNNVDGDFAPDGVYFRSAWGADRFRIWYYPFAFGRAHPVALPVANDIEALSLYTGGRVALVTYRAGLTSRIAVFVDGFAKPQTFGLPAENIVDAAFSRNDPELGVIALGTASTPRRYYRVHRGSRTLIYDANTSGIDPTLFAEARSLRISSFDGLEIPVHVFIPNATSAARARPAIVLIHGGPHDHVDPVYMPAVQFLANRGFIVVVPNVRGSTGFGLRYGVLDNGDWGGAHIRDTVAVAEFIRRLDFVAGADLFVAGESFGGFSVLSLITQYPTVFRAAADFFGFTELATFVDSWPPYLQRRVLDDLGFDPRVDGARNRARSPFYHVDRIRIPVQVHQGANDPRVPRAQSDRIVERMRERGRSVEYSVYADEGHGFTHRSNERTAFERMVRFFRRHMGQSGRKEGSSSGNSQE